MNAQSDELSTRAQREFPSTSDADGVGSRSHFRSGFLGPSFADFCWQLAWNAIKVAKKGQISSDKSFRKLKSQ